MEAYTEETVDAVVELVEENVIAIKKTINEAYAIQCSKGNMDASEERYRTFFIEFVDRIFGVKELSMKREFEVDMKVRASQ